MVSRGNAPFPKFRFGDRISVNFLNNTFMFLYTLNLLAEKRVVT